MELFSVPSMTFKVKVCVILRRNTLYTNVWEVFTILTAFFSASHPEAIALFLCSRSVQTVPLCLRKGEHKPNPSATQKAINELH
jgi:hypothetical protein